MTPRSLLFRPRAPWLSTAVAALICAGLAPADDHLVPGDVLPVLRRVLVPADRPQVWPAGDWQPVELAELERQFAAARAAERTRPGTFVEQADYTATVTDSELREGRLDWFLR